MNGSVDARTAQPADHRHADDLVEHPAEGRRDELPRRASTARDKADIKTHDPVHRRHPDHRPALHHTRTTHADDGPRPDADAAHHPHPGRHRGGRDARLRRHRREHLVPGRPARREPDARRRPLRAAGAAAGARPPPADAAAAAAAARSRHPGSTCAGRRADATSSSRRRAAAAAPAPPQPQVPPQASSTARPRPTRRRPSPRVGGRRRGAGAGVLRLRSGLPRARAGRSSRSILVRATSAAGPPGRHARRSGSIRRSSRPSSCGRSSAAAAGSPTRASRTGRVVIQLPGAHDARRARAPSPRSRCAAIAPGRVGARLRADGAAGRAPSPSTQAVVDVQMITHSPRRAPRSAAGFTMVELAVVAAMIAILAAMAVPVARYSLRRQKELELRYQLRMMRDAIDKYKQLLRRRA